MTDIDEKLLEQQEQEQKETEAAFAHTDMSEEAGNGHDKEEESETPMEEEELKQYQDQEEEREKEKNKEKAKATTTIDPALDLDPYILDRDYAEYIIDTAKKTVKREDTLIRQIVYTALSKDSDNPLNLAVLATTSEGKTHAVVETLRPFERLGLWVIGSMSPKVIIRQNGILVNNDNEPIEDAIVDLKQQIKECKRNGQGDQVENLQQQLRQLYDEAKILIDLTGKLFLFLERPHEDTWNIFKTTLSHDRWEIEHPYVYEVQGMGFKVKRVVLRGWPACVYCSAQNESRSPLWPEIQSRFLVTSPNMIPEKYQEGNMLIAQQMSLPRSIQKRIIRSNEETELAEKCAVYLSRQIKELSPQDPSADTQPVFIPYGGILGAILKWDRGTDNRINKRVFSFLRMIALSRAHLRYKLHYGHEKLVIADLAEDLHEVLHITQNFTGVPPDKLKEYKDVFLAAYKSKIGPNVSKDGTKAEDIIAVTTNECCQKHKEITGVGMNAKAYKPKYIDEWVNANLIEEQKSNIDNKQHIYFPITDLSDDDIVVSQNQTQRTESKSKCMSFLISNISGLGHRDNILQYSRIIVPKNFEGISEKWLELYIWGLLQYPDADDIFDIVDRNGQRVCLFGFIEDYVGKNRSLSGYVSNAVFYNNEKEISDQLKDLEDFDRKRCKILSLSCNLDIMDTDSSIEVGTKY
jgi:hypothetical protein